MSADTLHGQISKRADSLTMGAKERSREAEPHADCHYPAKGLEKHHLLQMETNRYFAAVGDRWFPHFLSMA